MHHHRGPFHDVLRCLVCKSIVTSAVCSSQIWSSSFRIDFSWPLWCVSLPGCDICCGSARGILCVKLLLSLVWMKLPRRSILNFPLVTACFVYPCSSCFRAVFSELYRLWSFVLLALIANLCCMSFAPLFIWLFSECLCFFVYAVFSPLSSFDRCSVMWSFLRLNFVIYCGLSLSLLDSLLTVFPIESNV